MTYNNAFPNMGRISVNGALWDVDVIECAGDGVHAAQPGKDKLQGSFVQASRDPGACNVLAHPAGSPPDPNSSAFRGGPITSMKCHDKVTREGDELAPWKAACNIRLWTKSTKLKDRGFVSQGVNAASGMSCKLLFLVFVFFFGSSEEAGAIMIRRRMQARNEDVSVGKKLLELVQEADLLVNSKSNIIGLYHQKLENEMLKVDSLRTVLEIALPGLEALGLKENIITKLIYTDGDQSFKHFVTGLNVNMHESKKQLSDRAVFLRTQHEQILSHMDKWKLWHLLFPLNTEQDVLWETLNDQLVAKHKSMAQLQSQNEELQLQNEELQVQNKELQVHNKELQVQVENSNLAFANPIVKHDASADNDDTVAGLVKELESQETGAQRDSAILRKLALLFHNLAPVIKELRALYYQQGGSLDHYDIAESQLRLAGYTDRTIGSSESLAGSDQNAATTATGKTSASLSTEGTSLQPPIKWVHLYEEMKELIVSLGLVKPKKQGC